MIIQPETSRRLVLSSTSCRAEQQPHCLHCLSLSKSIRKCSLNHSSFHTRLFRPGMCRLLPSAQSQPTVQALNKMRDINIFVFGFQMLSVINCNQYQIHQMWNLKCAYLKSNKQMSHFPPSMCKTFTTLTIFVVKVLQF